MKKLHLRLCSSMLSMLMLSTSMFVNATPTQKVNNTNPKKELSTKAKVGIGVGASAGGLTVLTGVGLLIYGLMGGFSKNSENDSQNAQEHINITTPDPHCPNTYGNLSAECAIIEGFTELSGATTLYNVQFIDTTVPGSSKEDLLDEFAPLGRNEISTVLTVCKDQVDAKNAENFLGANSFGPTVRNFRIPGRGMGESVSARCSLPTQSNQKLPSSHIYVSGQTEGTQEQQLGQFFAVFSSAAIDCYGKGNKVLMIDLSCIYDDVILSREVVGSASHRAKVAFRGLNGGMDKDAFLGTPRPDKPERNLKIIFTYDDSTRERAEDLIHDLKPSESGGQKPGRSPVGSITL